MVGGSLAGVGGCSVGSIVGSFIEVLLVKPFGGLSFSFWAIGGWSFKYASTRASRVVSKSHFADFSGYQMCVHLDKPGGTLPRQARWHTSPASQVARLRTPLSLSQWKRRLGTSAYLAKTHRALISPRCRVTRIGNAVLRSVNYRYLQPVHLCCHTSRHKCQSPCWMQLQEPIRRQKLH